MALNLADVNEIAAVDHDPNQSVNLLAFLLGDPFYIVHGLLDCVGCGDVVYVVSQAPRSFVFYDHPVIGCIGTTGSECSFFTHH